MIGNCKIYGSMDPCLFQKQWASRSEVAWQELSRSEPNSIQVQRHFSQQKEGADPLGKRKYSGGQEIHLLTREQWISDHIQSHVAGTNIKQLTLEPEPDLTSRVIFTVSLCDISLLLYICRVGQN